MIGRLLGGTAAVVFTGATVTGAALLIASDFADFSSAWNKFSVWMNKPVLQKPVSLGEAEALKGADNITFFHRAAVTGKPFEVTTGIAFANADDVIAGKTKNRWCYIQLGSGNFTQKLDLGSQSGSGKPVYVDTSTFTASQLRSTGMSAEALAKLARSHCLLKGFDPRKVNRIKTPSITLKPRKKKPQRPAKVWNWKKPYLPRARKEMELPV